MFLTLAKAPVLSFKAEGTPIPQGSKSALPGSGKASGRAVLVEGGNRKTKTKPANRLKRWRANVAHSCRSEMYRCNVAAVLDEPIVLGAVFVMPRPPGHITPATRELARDMQQLDKMAPMWPSVKPDLSKLIRAVEDALEGVIYKNDSRIVGYREPAKIYDDEESAGVKIEIWRVQYG